MTAARTESWPPPGWTSAVFPHGDHAHRFYTVDDTASAVGLESDAAPARPPAPRVLLLHEFPGLRSTIATFVAQLATDFRVIIPSMFGTDGSPSTLASARDICVRREIRMVSQDAVSKSLPWLRDFVNAYVADGDRPFGVIGMCFTGNFALGLAVDPRVKAAVVAEPAIPLWPSSLGLSDDDRAKVRARRDLKVRCYRYEGDGLSPAAKMRAIEQLLPADRVRTFELPALTGWHSTLTGTHPSDFARSDCHEFLLEQLVQ